MDKVKFNVKNANEMVEFYILEQARMNGIDYILVTVEEKGDSDAFILKNVAEGTSDDPQGEAIYEMVEAQEELEYMSKIFSEMLEDVDFIS
ncbi:DUF1292 domain-containing protein [Lachnospiraceae bacterium ZAX-1]